MSTQWWFKSLGQEFGPLSFDDLIEAARLRTFVSHDYVREGNSAWRRADSVAGLFTAARGDSWLVEVLGQTLGPLSLGEVTTMIRQRKLLPGDRIRHLDAANWQAVSAIFEQGDCAGAIAGRGGASSSIATDDLESLILSVLGAPSDCREKPSLDDLGLTTPPAAKDHRVGAVDPIASPADSPGLRPTSVGAPSFPRRLLSRAWRASEPDPQALVPQQGESAVDAMVASARLPALERHFDVPGGESAYLQATVSSGAPWRLMLLAVGSLVLILQLYPVLVSRTLAAIDIRNWAWNNWLAAEVAIVCVLIGLAVWRRR